MGSSNAAVADQVSVINQAISSGVDAICISTVDAAGVSDALQKQRMQESWLQHGILMQTAMTEL